MKLSKVFIIIAILFIFFMSSTMVLATINPDDFAPTINTKGSESVVYFGRKIVSAITVIGTIISVVGMMGLGIKYMMGSIEQKAEYKKTMWPIFIGMVLLFGTSWILKIIYEIVPNGISSISSIS